MNDSGTQNDQPEFAPRSPRERYESPGALVKDDGVNDEKKLHMLKQWRLDVEALLRAEGEGMNASNPISAKREAKLANEERMVSEALQELEGQ